MDTEITLKTEESVDEKKKSEKSSTGRKVQKKVLGAAAAMTTGTAVLVNGLFGSPDEMLKAADEINKPAVIHMIEDVSDEDPDDEDEEDEDESGPTSLWGKMRSWIWSWPLPLRILIGLPLWALGWGVCQGCHALWNLFLSPLLSALSGVLLLFAVLAGVLALAARAAFPELPLREVFKKSRLIALGVCSVLLEGFIALLPAIDTQLEPYAGLIRFGGGALIIAGLMVSLWVTKERRKRYVLGTA